MKQPNVDTHLTKQRDTMDNDQKLVEDSNVFANAIASGQSVMRIENETMQQFSITKPRPHPGEIIKLILSELEAFPEFASKAFYRIEIKKHASDPDDAEKQVIEGIGIKGAEQCKRYWGNCTSGCRMVAEDERTIHVQGVSIDYETNVRESREWVVQKFEFNKKTKLETKLSNFRLTTLIQAAMSKAERNAILLMLPEPLKARYFQTAKEIAVRVLGQPKGKEDPKKPLPLAQRVKKMFEKMEEIGATEAQMLAFFKITKKSEINEEHIGRALGVYNAVLQEHEHLEDVLGISSKKVQTVGEKQLGVIFPNNQKKK